MFFLLSILAYLRYAARPSASRFALVACAFILALLSKPMAITLPMVLLLLDFWPLGRLSGERALILGKRLPAYAALLVEKIPLFALSLASGLVTLAAQKSAILSTEVLPLGYRLMNLVVAYATYLRETIVPTRLAILYPLGPIDFLASFLPALLVLAAISAAAVVFRTRYPWLLFGWLWYLLMLLPVIGLIQVGPQSHADRYMYLPSIGLFLALGAALARLSVPASRKALLALAPALVFYSFIAWLQLGYWSGPYMLLTRSLEVAGETFQVHVMLAGFHLREGRLQEAQAQALKAISIGPDLPLGYAILGGVLAARKDYSGAEKLFRVALSKSPGDPRMLHNLGNLLEEQGRTEEARPYLEAASKADPSLYGTMAKLKRSQN